MAALRLMPPWVRRTALVMLVVQVALTACYAGYSHGLPGFRQFNMDGELNVPTWWSSFILTTTAFVAFGLWKTSERIGRPGIPWLGVGIGFLGLSLEEVASIHEDVGASAGGGSAHVSIWPLIYSPVLILGLWVLVRAVRDLPRPVAATALLGLVGYVAVIGIELGSLLGESHVTIAIEENLEMLGTGLMLWALAAELATRFTAAFPGALDEPATSLRAARPH